MKIMRTTDALLSCRFARWRQGAIVRGLQSNDLWRAYFAGYRRAIVRGNAELVRADRELQSVRAIAQADVDKWRRVAEEFSTQLMELKRAVRADRLVVDVQRVIETRSQNRR